MAMPFSPDVLRQVERLGGTWREVPTDATPLARVEALSFPKRLVSAGDVPNLHPTDVGLPDVEAFIALDAPLPDVPVTDALPCGVRWCGHEWQAGDITYQWDDGWGRDLPLVDLTADDAAVEELDRFRQLVGDPRASRAVLLTYSDGYPNYLFINADDPHPGDPAVWSTDHEGFFRELEAAAPSLSDWLGQQLTDEELYSLLRT